MILPKQDKNKHRRVARRPSRKRKTSLIQGIFAWFKSKRKTRRRKIVLTQESVGDFLRDYELASPHSLGRKYLRRRRWIALFHFIKKSILRLISFATKTSLRLTFTVAILIVICGAIPTILGAPRSYTVTTKAQWDQGAATDVVTDGATDAIQLEPQGTWNSRIWTPTPDTVGNGSSSAMADNYLYTTRGYSSKAFWRYNVEKNQWEILSDLPLPANTGADLSYIPDQKAVFATFGGYSTGFYKYDLDEKNWSQLENLPDGVLNGGSLETDGTDLYFLRGNASTDFYRYDTGVESNHWEPLSGPPATVSTGSSMIYDPVGSYMYVARGSNTNTFYRYKTAGTGAGTWSTMAAISVGGTSYTINGETKGVYWTDGTVRYIYLLRSTNTNTFLRYQINCNDGSDGTCAGEKDTWTLVTESGQNAPNTTNYASLTYNDTDGYIYALRGNGTQDLWKFDPDGTNDQKWVGVKPIQDSAGTLRVANTGAGLIYNGGYGGTNKIFAITPVGATAYLNAYDPSNNTWSSSGMNNISGTINTDVSGTFDKNDGYIYYPAGGSKNFYRSANGGAWSTIAVSTLSANAGNGTSMAYISSTARVYILQGSGSNNFWSCDVNLANCVSAGTTTVSGVNYYPNVGARLVSLGTYSNSTTDLYATVGNGETTFLKYSSGAWSLAADTPFSQYYGVSLTAYNGKIYALAGYYRDETWEYDPASNAWRRLPRNQKYSWDRGVYNGAAIAWDGGTSLYATPGYGPL